MAQEETKTNLENESKTETVETIEPVFAEDNETEAVQSSLLEEYQSKLEEADSRYLRLQADFDNFRRRTKIDFDAIEKYRAQNIISDLLPVLDNFERALQTQVDQEQAKSLLQGMEMVYRLLSEAIKKEGVETIEAVGKEFDPHLHQAVMQVEAEDSRSGMVLEEFQKGYKLKDRVIRPSMVKVSQ
ncbi:MAG TPA: nucleotide exchange factor GrpE [Pseudoneobacillus sp.]|nr:nucleotide exchange factor GrpE [Pseudoneobacillus sp.]